MLVLERLKSKKISKTESVQSQLDERLESGNIHIGPSDYVPWQKDNKVAFIRPRRRGLRRGADRTRAAPVGTGFAQQCRRRHRCRPLRRARPRARIGGLVGGRLGVSHEIAAQADARLCRPRSVRSLHPRRQPRTRCRRSGGSRRVERCSTDPAQAARTSVVNGTRERANV